MSFWQQLKTIYKWRSFRLAMVIIILIPGAPFVLGSLGYFVYLFWPRDYSSVTQIILDPAAVHLTLSAHGVKDNANSWSDPLQIAMSAQSNIPSQHISLNWQAYSENALTCSVSAKKIGHELGQRIALFTNIQSIHAIGHSCGAFIVLGICEGAKKIRHNIKVQSTYLDPVSVYAGFWWQYGINHFGACADFSDAYIDTEDTIPGSNEKLPYAHTFDVTQSRILNQINEAPHNWPAQYYLKAFTNRKVPLLINASGDLYDLYPKGKLSKITD